MIRIILGILVITGSLMRAIQKPYDAAIVNPFELNGYLLGKVFLIFLGIWLIYTGLQRKSQKVQKTDEKVLSPVDFLKLYFSDFNFFITKYFKIKNPPYWLICLGALGSARVLLKIHYSIIGGHIGYPIQDWFTLWIFSVVSGFVIGFVMYWIFGSIFHLGVLIAGGNRNAKISRMIYLYSSLPVYLSVVMFMFINMIVFESEYFSFGGSMNSIWIGVVLTSIATLYSIILAYRGVRSLQKTKKVQSIILFIILPIAIQAVLYIYS